jgi:carbon monoxide dehydrogenase subunit G
MPPIITTTEIDRPATEVFEYATDPTRFSEWQKGVVDGHMDHVGTPKVGDLCRTTRHIGGSNRASTSRVTHIDPPRSWGVHGTDGPIRATVDVTVEPLTESRSRLTISVDFDGHGIGKALVPLLVRRRAEKEMPTNLTTLKQRLEGRRQTTS